MASNSNKQGKMAGYINWRMKITMADTRTMQGQMLAFDKHMNIVLADTEEFRKIRKRLVVPAKRRRDPKGDGDGDDDGDDDDDGKDGAGADVEEITEREEKRTLGLLIIRGQHIVSVEPLSPPPQDPSARLGKSTAGQATSLAAGPGVSRPAGRVAAAPPSALAGPAPGVGVGMPPGYPGFPGGPPPPGFPGRGGPPGAFPPPAGFPGGLPGGPFPPQFFPPGGGPPPGPPGFQPHQRR